MLRKLRLANEEKGSARSLGGMRGLWNSPGVAKEGRHCNSLVGMRVAFVSGLGGIERTIDDMETRLVMTDASPVPKDNANVVFLSF